MAEVEHRKASIVADIFHWIKESRQSVMIKQISSMDSCGATKEDGYVCITSFLEVKILFLFLTWPSLAEPHSSNW